MANTYFSYAIADFVPYTKILSASVNSRYSDIATALNGAVTLGFTDQGSDPTTPAASTMALYTKSQSFYTRNASGTVRNLLSNTETQTVSNKTLDNSNAITVKDGSFTLQNTTDTTKQAVLSLAGNTTGTTRTYTLPDYNATVATLAGSETFTNKTISRSSNTLSGYTAHAVVTADSSGNASAGVAPSTSGFVLKSNGTDWASASPSIVNIATKTTTYSVVTSDAVILADATSAGFTITLPAASNAGFKVVIKKVDSSANVVTISRAGSDTIEGATTRTLRYQYESLTLVADGGTLFAVVDSRLDSGWKSYTITNSGWATAGTYSAMYSKRGDSGEFCGSLRLTGAPTGTFQFSQTDFFGNLSLGIDSSRMPGQTDTQIAIGTWEGYDNGIANYGGTMYLDTSNGQILFHNNSTSVVTATSPFTWGSTDSITWHTNLLPITNWAY